MDGHDWFLVKFLGWVCFGISILFLITRIIEIVFFGNVAIRVLINNEIIYQGPSIAIESSTAGSNTNLKISGGFLYLFPKAIYTDKNIKIETVQEILDTVK